MKKRKSIIAISALTALTLVGCSKNLIADKNGNVVTVTIGDSTQKISVGDLFNVDLTTNDGIKRYYDAVYQVVVRELFETKQKTKRAEIYEKAELRVKEVKDQAKSNATSGSRYDEELKKLLKTHNVENVKELREKFAYELMQDELKTQFFDGGSGSWAPDAWNELVVGERDSLGELVLDDGGNPVYEGYLQNKLPYHVRHILVKVSAAHGNVSNATISKAEAIKLSATIEALAKRRTYDTFGSLARLLSEDDGGGNGGSAGNYGDLGIMSTSTSYVNEFKLGVYAYEGIFNQAVPAPAKAKLQIPDTAKTFLETKGIGEIPYGVVEQLKTFADVEKDSNGREVKEGIGFYFPRNIYFNKYLNKHIISVITPNSLNVNDEVGVEDAGFAALPGFRAVPELGGQKVLTDERGNVILAVRAGSSGSYEGIHFIVVERSALVETVNDVTLEEYYTTSLPKSDNFPKYVGGVKDGEDKDVYVNFLKGDANQYKNRADTIKNEIKNFDPRINDRIYKKLATELDVKIHDEKLEGALEAYLQKQYASAQFNLDQELVKLWEEWVDTLDYQYQDRAARLIPETCAINFESGVGYETGGACDLYEK